MVVDEQTSMPADLVAVGHNAASIDMVAAGRGCVRMRLVDCMTIVFGSSKLLQDLSVPSLTG